jgi:hypothetical protein
MKANKEDEIQQRDLYDRPFGPKSSDGWSRGTLGDAVHAMMPNLGYRMEAIE